MKKNKIAVFMLVFFMLLGVGFLGFYYKMSHEQNTPTLPIVGGDQNHHIAPFSFVNQDGRTITNADVKGKICVVEYFFATCRGMCPKMNENMEQVYKAYLGNKRVLILSHTVDPLKDTVQALKAYSMKFDADPNQWMFLTGDKKQLYDMARYSYLISANDDTSGVSIDKDFIHDQHYVLVDGYGRIRGFYNGLDLGSVHKLIGDIGILLKENP